MLTVDLQVLGQRHRDVRNGLTVPPEIRIKNIIDIATKPRWLWSIARAKSWTFGNISGHVPGMENVNSLAQWTNDQFDPALNWQDVAWIKSHWPGKLIIKGILDPEDAKIALDVGADALVVSNHGGRQLDGAPSSIAALPKVVETVGDKTEVLFDGGIRTGADILRAIALGRARVPDRPRLCLRPRRGGTGRRGESHRDPHQGARCHHGAVRHQEHRRDRPAGDRGGGIARCRGGGAAGARGCGQG